jgi:hypothetical protein
MEWPVQDSYVLTSDPAIDLAVGEDAVFFLDYEAVDGRTTAATEASAGTHQPGRQPPATAG